MTIVVERYLNSLSEDILTATVNCIKPYKDQFI